ncbi:low molecular weight protein-tyrosine-phosphatase [Alcanivorax quisquiliarum]|uniref:protein-tyrosine-phosphatase n=1 Tax=Alcanivorax quisquiliarum TaxID=2933565 RepID=A0ABT0EA73_9GAMM|nr:low molecular weight protein-tyrosine-phosphatase [Alcanivorax quisquiliarum]MCK0538699.1 low molecular weight phosphotyrosine protein phosphatase [Alcanivorax quisquiliarum]
MFDSILVVCDGNICRSPTAAVLLANATGKQVTSAGLVALVDHDMDALAREVALENGLECPPHVARKLTREMCRAADLILVMETRQRDRVAALAPEASGKTLLLGKWLGEKEVPDPYKRHREVYDHAYKLITQAVDAWAKRLA